MKQPLVYIILINWNGLVDTLECLESLKNINYKNYKIIVVDNGSKGNQADVIKYNFQNIELIENEENKGFVIANNQGIELAIKNNADYILLLNNDTVVERNFLNILIDYGEKNKEAGILSPKILYYNSDKIWSMGGKISYLSGLSIMIGKGKDSQKYNRIIEPNFITGCAMLIKREVINKIGLLDPLYFAYYEDSDCCFRAKKAGYEIRIIPESVIWHKKSASAGIRGSNKITPMQAYLWARNGIIFGRKNLIGTQKATFLFGQFTFKLLFSLINCQNIKAVKKYFKGLYDGVRYY